MPEGDEGLDVSCSKCANDVLIVRDSLFIPFSFFGLNARPLNGKAIGGMI